jgi:hypothetical protein
MILLLEFGFYGSGKVFCTDKLLVVVSRPQDVQAITRLNLRIREPHPLALVFVLLCIVVVKHL